MSFECSLNVILQKCTLSSISDVSCVGLEAGFWMQRGKRRVGQIRMFSWLGEWVQPQPHSLNSKWEESQVGKLQPSGTGTKETQPVGTLIKTIFKFYYEKNAISFRYRNSPIYLFPLSILSLFLCIFWYTVSFPKEFLISCDTWVVLLELFKFTHTHLVCSVWVFVLPSSLFKALRKH